jgi:hypothetical protein
VREEALTFSTAGLKTIELQEGTPEEEASAMVALAVLHQAALSQ